MAGEEQGRVRLLDWLRDSPAQWGVWIGERFIVASYAGMIALFERSSGAVLWLIERSSGAVLWHGGVGERLNLDQMILESCGETFALF
jgi:hypothetical protein